jgi:hypothetical protein
MDVVSKLALLALGASLAACGAYVRWRVSRHDLKGAAVDSAIHVVLRRRSAENPTALEKTWREVAEAPTPATRAKRAGWVVASHFLSQAAGLVALAAILAGIAIAGVGLFLR